MRVAVCLASLLVLVIAARAGARPLDPLHGAKLQFATGTLTISESRCSPGSTGCATVKLQEDFKTGPQPRTRTADGQPGFPAGMRIAGAGRGLCSAESPPTVVTGADGSVQFLGSAARVEPGKFVATRVIMAAGSRGLRLAWLEPLAPGVVCGYFDEAGTTLAVPPKPKLQSSLASPGVLKRSRFSLTVAGSQVWTQRASDGTQVAGRATWRLRLDYRR